MLLESQVKICCLFHKIFMNGSYHFGLSGLPALDNTNKIHMEPFYVLSLFILPFKIGPHPFSCSGECIHAVKLQKSVLIYKNSPST